MDTLKKRKSLLIRILIIVSLLILVLAYFYVETIKDIINIVLLSFILAYILKPVKKIIIGRERVKDSTAAIIIILGIIIIFIIALVIMVPSLFKEINNLEPTLEKMYKYIEDLSKGNRFGDSAFIRFLYEGGKEKLSEIFLSLSQGVVDNVVSFSENLLSLAIIPVVTYYFLADNGRISGKVYLFIPLEKRNIAKKIISDIDRLLDRYIISQLVLSIIIGVLTLISLIILKVKFPLWLSLLNGLFNIIPYFGPIFGGIPIVFVAMLDSPIKALWAGIIIFILQQIEGNILSPKITGDSTNIHPLIIIILLLIGEKFGGFLGMILIIPLGVIIKVIYEDINYYLF